MLKAMDRRLHNEYATQASLHGIKIPLRHNHEVSSAAEPVTPMEEAKMHEALVAAQSRVKARYGR